MNLRPSSAIVGVEDNVSKDLKVGFFVLMGLVLAGLVIFLIGNERRFFDRSLDFHTSFDDVQGLRPGAPIMMSGVRVGQVDKVGYGEGDGTTVVVALSIVEDSAKRIRSDAWVQIENKGLLGDKMLVLHPGATGTSVEEGAYIESRREDGLMDRLDGVAAEAEGALKDVRALTKTLGDEQLHEDLRGSVRGVNTLLKEVTEGQGYPHRFLTDPNEAERISKTVEALSGSAAELNQTLREVRLAVRQVRQGPGFAHDVIYGDGPKKEIAQIGFAAEEVALTLQGIRGGNGFAHDLLYGGEGGTQDAVTNITQATADLRDIIAGVKAGKGTIGALLVDPSIYEDVKRLVGNVGRNDVLRALVRYSIKRDETPNRVEVGKKDE
jgi:phospholipid/cholesterol/gamma-HCH transport system substrate-binding protein